MQAEEIIACVRDQSARMTRNSFTGTLRVEIHWNNGTARRAVVIEEPQRLEFVAYPNANSEKKIFSEKC